MGKGYGISMLKRLADRFPDAVAQLRLQVRCNLKQYYTYSPFFFYCLIISVSYHELKQMHHFSYSTFFIIFLVSYESGYLQFMQRYCI